MDQDLARRVVQPAGLTDPPGWSHAVAAGGWIFGSGILAADFETGLLDEARPDPASPWLSEPLDAESRLILERIGLILEAADADLRRDLIRLWQWIVARYPHPAVYAASRSFWPCLPSGTPYARNLVEMVGDPQRASTGIGVRELPAPGAQLSVDFIAVQPRPELAKAGVPLPAELPQPKIGYSPITRYGDWIFLAGFGATDFKGDWQTPLAMGEPSLVAPAARINPYIWLGSEIEAQAEYTLRAMARMAEAAGSSLDRCVKADVTLTHPSDYAGFERVWRRYFPDSPPARNLVTGTQLVIKGLRVEIALLLLAGDADVERTPLDAPGVPRLGHTPHAVHAGDFLFTSGLLAHDAAGRIPSAIAVAADAPAFRDPAQAQSRVIAARLAQICELAGTKLGEVCKVQAFLDDMAHLPGMFTAWRDVFAEAPPALSMVATGGGDPLLLPGACVQWDAIVYAPRQRRSPRAAKGE